MSREKLLSVTLKDCKVESFRPSVKAGGQHKDKVSNAVRISHEPSGAVAQCQDFREKSKNIKKAFERMVQTEKFQAWIRLQAIDMALIEQAVDRKMKQPIKVEVKEDGLWVDFDS